MADDLSQLIDDVSEFRRQVTALKAKLVSQARQLRQLGDEAGTLLDAALHLLQEQDERDDGEEWKR